MGEHWDKKTSVKKNLKGMGLCADPNQMMSVPLTKETMIPGNDDYDPYYDEEKESTPKTNIIENIEKVAASGKIPRCKLKRKSTDSLEFIPSFTRTTPRPKSDLLYCVLYISTICHAHVFLQSPLLSAFLPLLL